MNALKQKTCACGCGRTVGKEAWRIYFSRSCAAKINNSKHPKRQKKKRSICPRCGSEKENDRRDNTLCIECKAAAAIERSKKRRLKDEMLKNLGNMTLSETLEHETKKTGIGKFWAIRHHCSETLNDLKAYPCKLCGYSLHVELCHVKAIHRCFKETPHMLVKEVNSRANVIPLCRNCHWELDNGHIQMKE